MQLPSTSVAYQLDEQHSVPRQSCCCFSRGTLMPVLAQTKVFRGSYQSPVTFFTMPLMSAVARETAKVQLTARGRLGVSDSLTWDPKLVK